MDRLAPPVFKSPLNGSPAKGEEEAFSSLVSLYDRWAAALDAFLAAKKCGSADDVAKAQAALTAARTTLDDAAEQYARDYSPQLYTPNVSRRKNFQLSHDFFAVLDAVEKASKYAKTRIQACPAPRQDTTGNPQPKPEPAPPPKPGLVEDLLGHVSIGVGVGIGGDSRGRDDNRRRDDHRRDDDRTPDSTDRR